MTAEAEPSALPPGAWSDAIPAEAEKRLGDEFAQLGGQQLEMSRPWTLEQIDEFLGQWQRLFPQPPAQLRCHPSVLRGLVALTGQQPGNWPSLDRPDLVRIEIYTDPDLPDGAWELHRGDEVVDQGVIAPEATA